MLAEKRWIIIITFSVVLCASVGVAEVFLISSVYFFEGGLDNVLRFWRENGKGFSDSWKWVLFLGIAVGIGAAIVLWRWFMLGTGLLTREELDEVMGREARKK